MLQQILRQAVLLTACWAIPLACPAAYLQFTFEGVWEDIAGNSDPQYALTPLIGTAFTGRIVIPTSGFDLDAEAYRGLYEFSSSEAIFEIDVLGDDFDITTPPVVVVEVFNDATPGEFLFCCDDGPPFYDHLRVSVEVDGYNIFLEAGIRQGSPPTAFSSDGIPSDAEILSTAAISLSYAAMNVYDPNATWLVATQPLPALLPPGSISDNLDITVTTVPLSDSLVYLLMALCTIGVWRTRPFALTDINAATR